MKYQAIFFPDPYNLGIREVIMSQELQELADYTVGKLQRDPDLTFCLYELCGKRWKQCSRSVYFEINKKLGRV